MYIEEAKEKIAKMTKAERQLFILSEWKNFIDNHPNKESIIEENRK
jgi:hypothetical protein